MKCDEVILKGHTGEAERDQLTPDRSEGLVASPPAAVRAVVQQVGSRRGAAEGETRGAVHLW